MLCKRTPAKYVWFTNCASTSITIAQSLLTAEREFRERVHTRLEMPATVVSAAGAGEAPVDASSVGGGQTSSQLEQLRECLRLLDELRDMENKIDERYLPIETLYARLKQFDLILPKQVRTLALLQSLYSTYSYERYE